MTKKSKQTSESPATAKRAPIALLAAAWIIPGLGHWILGKRTRALVFGGVVLACFITGVLIDGELGIPQRGNPFSWLTTFACIGNGILYFIRLIWINGIGSLFSGGPANELVGGGNPVAAGFTYGNTFLYSAGLMNLLTILDISDIARGEKD